MEQKHTPIDPVHLYQKYWIDQYSGPGDKENKNMSSMNFLNTIADCRAGIIGSQYNKWYTSWLEGWNERLKNARFGYDVIH